MLLTNLLGKDIQRIFSEGRVRSGRFCAQKIAANQRNFMERGRKEPLAGRGAFLAPPKTIFQDGIVFFLFYDMICVMKQGIHPTYYPEAKVTCACGNTFTVGSTLPTLEVEACSACHPFYTGQDKLMDKVGRVQKFKERLAKKQAPPRVSRDKLGIARGKQTRGKKAKTKTSKQTRAKKA